MVMLHVAVSEETQRFVEAQAAAHGYRDPADYVQSLIAVAQGEHERGKLDALLAQRMQQAASDPSVELTCAEQDDLRKKYREGLAQRCAWQAGPIAENGRVATTRRDR